MGRKAVFIGLGGAGILSTAFLKEKLLFGVYKGKIRELEEDCQFIFIDTDSDTVSDINERSKNRFAPGEKLINEIETVRLGNVVPYSVYMERKNKDPRSLTDEEHHLLSWIDDLGANTFTRQQLEKGAGANRQQGRVAFWDKFDFIRSAIIRSFDILKGIKNKDDYDAAYPVFHILTGTCGGTGSSLFLDVAYMLNLEFKRLTGHQFGGDPTVRAVFFMPQWYINRYIQDRSHQIVIENYYCNAYAFFDEVNGVLKNAYSPTEYTDKKSFQSFAAYPVKDYRVFENASKNWAIFNFALCVDTTTELGYSLDQFEMYRNTAEFLYHWHMGSAQNTLISNIDNGQFNVYNNTPPGSEVPAFFTMGYRALEFPQSYLADYMKTRFLYELFKHGLKGKGERELPDDDKRRQELSNTFNACIGRYLFGSTIKSKDVPNLEDSQREIIRNHLSTFNLARFMKDKKEEVDTDKIGDNYILVQFLKDRESLINTINQKLEKTFTAEESPVSSRHLLGYIEKGHAGEGSLQDEIENLILLYGLEYTVWFLRKLDGICEEKVDSADESVADLYGERETRFREKEHIKGQIDQAIQICLTGKKKEKIAALNALYGLLQSDITISGEVTIINQQMDILKRLSTEGTGLLEIYLKRLRDLNDSIDKKLNGDEKKNIIGFIKKYQTELPKRFMQTRQNVTTTYIPDIASFFADGEKTDHLFAKLYERIVPQQPLPGGDVEPVRYGQNFGRHAEKQGLHKILWNMLALPDYSPHEKGYEEKGMVSFFRKFFDAAANDLDLNAVLEILESRATAYMEKEMERSPYVAEEVNKPLLKRIDSGNIAELLKKFDGLGTQTFCRMEKTGGGQNAVYNVYAGNDEQLAKKLLYDENSHQFIEEDTPNRIIKMKLCPLFTIESYPHYSTYKAQYDLIKSQRRAQGTIFAPHIHAIFNKLGVEEGLRRIDDMAGDGQVKRQKERFVSLLLYREMCETARTEAPHLLRQIFFFNDRLCGDETTLQTPLAIEKQGEKGLFLALVCGRIEQRASQILLKAGNYINITAGAKNFKDIFDRLILRDDLLIITAAIDSFGYEFKKRLTAEWLPVFEKAAESLFDKIKRISDKCEGDAIQPFFVELGNCLEIKIKPLFKNQIEVARPGTAGAPGVGASSFDAEKYIQDEM